MSQSTDPRFRNVEVQYQTLKSQLASGALTPEQFEAALQGLMILDEQGRYWMMGAESGRWYAYEGQVWVQRDPPGGTTPAPAPPPAPPAGAAMPRPDAVTLTSFTPPALPSRQEPVPADKATTQASFTPPAPGQPVDIKATPEQDGSKRRGMSPVLLMAGLFLLVCVVGAFALVYAAYGRFFGAAPMPTAVPAVPIAASPTPAVTISATPTNVLPTVAPTGVPQRTPPVIVIPTNLPTVPPAPTPEPATPTTPPAPIATNTPAPPPPPTRTPVPQFTLAFSFQGYQRWGRPEKDSCSAFNDKDPVRQFLWDVLLTNRSNSTVNPSEWSGSAFNNEGGEVKVCPSNLPAIPAGQTAKATFVTYVNLNQYVGRVLHRIRNASFERCLDAAWKEIPC